jgi:hypothetical protein
VLAAAGHRTVRVTDRQLSEQRADTAERFTVLLARSGSAAFPTQRS